MQYNNNINWTTGKRIKSDLEPTSAMSTQNYQVDIIEQTDKGAVVHTLSFSNYQKVPKIGMDLAGCQYYIHGRVYTDVVSLKEKELERISENIRVFSDCYGNTVLTFYVDIPTFDSGDRKWDSLHAKYLLFDGEDYALISCRRGYSIAKIEIYSGLVSVSKSMEPWFKRLGFD